MLIRFVLNPPDPDELGRRLRDTFIRAEKRKNEQLDHLDEKPKHDDAPAEPLGGSQWIVSDDGELVEVKKK